MKKKAADEDSSWWSAAKEADIPSGVAFVVVRTSEASMISRTARREWKGNFGGFWSHLLIKRLPQVRLPLLVRFEKRSLVTRGARRSGFWHLALLGCRTVPFRAAASRGLGLQGVARRNCRARGASQGCTPFGCKSRGLVLARAAQQRKRDVAWLEKPRGEGASQKTLCARS